MKKKFLSLVLALVIVLSFSLASIPSTFASTENIPPYDYESFIGTWYWEGQGTVGMSGEWLYLYIYEVNENQIIFNVDDFDYYNPKNAVITNNQFEYYDSENGPTYYQVTFYDNSIHLKTTHYSGDGDYTYEYWFAPAHDSNIKPRKIQTGNYSVVLNGTKLEFDQNPIMCGERILVPLRTIFEELEATVDYVSEYNERYRSELIEITATKDTMKLYISKVVSAGSWKYAIGDGNAMAFEDTPPIILNGRTLVPVRVVSEALGADVDWNDDAQTVIIDTSNGGQSEKIEWTGIPVKLTDIFEKTYGELFGAGYRPSDTATRGAWGYQLPEGLIVYFDSIHFAYTEPQEVPTDLKPSMIGGNLTHLFPHKDKVTIAEMEVIFGDAFSYSIKQPEDGDYTPMGFLRIDGYFFTFPLDMSSGGIIRDFEMSPSY